MWKQAVLGFEPMTYGSESECASHYTTAPHFCADGRQTFCIYGRIQSLISACIYGITATKPRPTTLTNSYAVLNCAWHELGKSKTKIILRDWLTPTNTRVHDTQSGRSCFSRSSLRYTNRAPDVNQNDLFIGCCRLSVCMHVCVCVCVFPSVCADIHVNAIAQIILPCSPSPHDHDVRPRLSRLITSSQQTIISPAMSRIAGAVRQVLDHRRAVRQSNQQGVVIWRNGKNRPTS